MFNNIDHSLQRLETLLASLSLFLLLALSLFQILLRNILDFGYPEVDIINRHLLVVCGMMGAVLATSKVSHIKTDALGVLLSAETKYKLQLPLSLFASIVCAALAYYSVIFVSDEWLYAPTNERWTLPFTLIYPISFALMSLHFVLNEITGNKKVNQAGND